MTNTILDSHMKIPYGVMLFFFELAAVNEGLNATLSHHGYSICSDSRHRMKETILTFQLNASDAISSKFTKGQTFMINEQHGRAHWQFHTSLRTQAQPMSFYHLYNFCCIQFYRNSNVITNAIRDASILVCSESSCSHVKQHKVMCELWIPFFSFLLKNVCEILLLYCLESIKTNWKMFQQWSEIRMSKINSFRNCERTENWLADWKQANNRHEQHQAVLNRRTVGMISNNHKFQFLIYFPSQFETKG